MVRRATDIQGGAAYGYKLLIAILLSNFAAMFLQFLSLKLGVVAERDLAQACSDAYPKVLPRSVFILYVICTSEIAHVFSRANHPHGGLLLMVHAQACIGCS